jgi:ABC-type transport system substrate-binding protein/class 3 adenylate cyclase
MTATGERRIVSVLVVDVAGSTGIAERLGPERSKFLFDEVVTLMREEVERFGGTVAQLTGDGLLALFGAPSAHEDDPERAVRAGLTMAEAISRYGEEIGTAYGVELGIRTAVNTGPVVVPEGEAPPAELYNALGDTVNVAARLQALGDLVVGPETARHLAGSFELEPLGDVDLKGKVEPVSAFRVLREIEAPAVSPWTPLVGRETELALLEGALEDLSDGRSAIVVLTGEPGVGKSRLKSEARDRVRDRVRFLEGHAVSYASEIPYWPLRELLRDWLGLGVSDPEARVRLELRAGLAGVLGSDADDVYPFLASALALPLDAPTETRLREFSRDSVQQQTFDALYRLACALAAQRPLCLVLEDLQWADEATLAAVEALLPVTDEQPVALVLSYRTEDEHGGWDLAERARRRFRHRFLELDLGPLETAAAVELAEGAAGAELPAAVAALLAERSGGNPFFLEEALRDLLDRGVLRRTNGRVELANGDEVAVPAAVEETLQARLDRLEPAAREVVSVASVVGRSFGVPLLEQLVPAERLRPALSELQRLDLVVEERCRPALEYRFRHGLVQEVAYSRLLEKRRRDLHRAVGEALEQLHRDSPEETYGLLARHYSEADDPERAVAYLLKAADAARAVYAEDEAIELYRRALAFMERTGDGARARDTLLKVALTHHLAFEFEHAARAFEEAFARPAPEVSRLEPVERLTLTTPVVDGFVPGRCYAEYSSELCRHLYRGLVAIGPNLEILPDLAQSFAVSTDGRTYHFRLRDDARWSDGEAVTAYDFAFAWLRMREEHVLTAHLLDDVASVEALEGGTLEIRLRRPTNYFLYLLGQPWFFAWPRHVCETRGPNWYEERPLVGNGPFVLEEADEQRARLVASPRWRGARGNILEIEVDFVASDEEVAARWRRGRYDFVLFLRATERGENTVIDSSAGMSTEYLAFRTDRPPLDDVRVRRALAHAIDRRRYAQHSGRPGDPAGAGGFIPPTMPGHSHRVAPEYDPEAARALLAEAGYPNGDGLRELAIGQLEDWFLVGDIADQLADVGVRARVIRAPFEAFDDLIRGDADTFVWGWNADFPDPEGMISLFFEAHPFVFRDAAVETLFNRVRSLSDQDRRLEAYREIEQLWIGEHVALVPLQYDRRTSVLRPWIERFWQNALATSTLAEAVVSR